MRSSRSNWSVFRVDCRQPGHYTRFGVTSGWPVIRPELRKSRNSPLLAPSALAIWRKGTLNLKSPLQTSIAISHRCFRPLPNQPMLFRYSVRRVRIGSVRIARVAGIYMAISETAASRTAEIPNTAESNRWSGNGDLASNRLSSNMAGSANAIPPINPIAILLTARKRTNRKISARLAPSTILIPNSRVR
jgi:hypothetical protein